MHSIGQQPPARIVHNASGAEKAGITGAANDDDHDVPLGGPHDYETRVQSYLQSLKACIESASVRRKRVAGEGRTDDDK